MWKKQIINQNEISNQEIKNLIYTIRRKHRNCRKNYETILKYTDFSIKYNKKFSILLSENKHNIIKDKNYGGNIFMKTLYYIALTLVIIGAINWLLIGIFKFDLVTSLFGDMSVLSRIVYSLVGISGLISIGIYSKIDK